LISRAWSPVSRDSDSVRIAASLTPINLGKGVISYQRARYAWRWELGDEAEQQNIEHRTLNIER
jgi:hypothetical protein